MSLHRVVLFSGFLLSFSLAPRQGHAVEPSGESLPPLEAAIDAGHSYHGEVFNEGPRQRAYLMPGTGKVHFPVTTESEEAQKFVEQGLGQIYGFWNLEAERSFRQAAAIDPKCAMAYWGAALANGRNSKRAKGFMKEAMKHRDKASKREQIYLDAYNKFVNADSKKRKESGEAYVAALESLLLEYPDDTEAKALLALQLYLNRSRGSKIVSYMAIDALLGEVFQAEPLHSAHHFRIHLWDSKKPEKALQSAAKCGEASPGIAHMWHMPGHIYSRLKRYNEACWQQEASARVDHAHMMRDRVLPDEIHNFAHNNEWLIRNLTYVGRMDDGLSLARNMLELPRHPKHNTPRRGSANYGRRRLLEVLRRYELWEQAIAMDDAGYIEPGDSVRSKMERLMLLGAARFRLAEKAEKTASSADWKAGEKILADIAQQLESKRSARDEAKDAAKRKYYRDKVKEWALDDAKGKPLPPWEAQPKALSASQKKALAKASTDAGKKYDTDIRALEKAQRFVTGWKLAAEGKSKEAYETLRKAGGVEMHLLAPMQFAAGEKDKAIDAMKRDVASHKNEVLPLGAYVDLLWQNGKKDEAKKQLELLAKVGTQLDLHSPVARRIAPIAEALKLAKSGEDWRVPFKVGDDFGERPSLDELGPFRWRPSPAPSWTLPNAKNQPVSLTDYKGRPVIVIFYLGYGCLHCVEQLQKFSPMAKQFADAGIELVAVSSDDVEGLVTSIKDFKPGKLDIPLVADPKLDVFKQYRAFDDFEDLALHGTFLINEEGMVLWQDISYEPFMDADFLLKEAPRLLKLQRSVAQPKQTTARPSAGG